MLLFFSSNPLDHHMRINKLAKSKSLVNNMTGNNGQSSPRPKFNQASKGDGGGEAPFMTRSKGNLNWNVSRRGINLSLTEKKVQFANRLISPKHTKKKAQVSVVNSSLKKNHSATDLSGLLLSNSTPRILELDVNRVMISQNQIT